MGLFIIGRGRKIIHIYTYIGTHGNKYTKVRFVEKYYYCCYYYYEKKGGQI